MKSNDMRESKIEEEMKKVELVENKMKEMDELLKDSVYHIEKEERVKNMQSNDKEESKTKEEEEVIVDEQYLNFGSSNMMMIAKGVKESVVSREWIRDYLEVMKIDEIKEQRSNRSFRIGERPYLNEVEVRFPIELKTDSGIVEPI